MKRITAVIILLMLLTACGKSEFGVTENTGKHMTITAVNADKGDFFIIGSLEVADGEEITAAADLTKGSIRVEIFKWADEQNADKLPTADKDAETIITANLRSTESVSGSVQPGHYSIKAVCLEKATGTVRIEAKPAALSDHIGEKFTGEDPWGNPVSIELKSAEGSTVTFEYTAVIGEGEYKNTFRAEFSGESPAGSMPFRVTAAAQENEALHLDYSGTLTLKNGALFVTYDAGSVTEESTEGGSASYQAQGLEEEEKIVELTAG